MHVPDGRPRTTGVLAGVLVLLVAVGLLLWSLPSTPATAQPATVVVVVSDIPVTPVNGHALLAIGSDDGVLAVHCDGGSGPGRVLGGSVVPAIVLDRLDPDATRLRITSWGLNTPAVNGQTVFIGCTFEALAGAAPTLRTLNTPAGASLRRGGQ